MKWFNRLRYIPFFTLLVVWSIALSLTQQSVGWEMPASTLTAITTCISALCLLLLAEIGIAIFDRAAFKRNSPLANGIYWISIIEVALLCAIYMAQENILFQLQRYRALSAILKYAYIWGTVLAFGCFVFLTYEKNKKPSRI